MYRGGLAKDRPAADQSRHHHERLPSLMMKIYIGISEWSTSFNKAVDIGSRPLDKEFYIFPTLVLEEKKSCWIHRDEVEIVQSTFQVVRVDYTWLTRDSRTWRYRRQERTSGQHLDNSNWDEVHLKRFHPCEWLFWLDSCNLSIHPKPFLFLKQATPNEFGKQLAICFIICSVRLALSWG